jgi:hypothetical protein
VARMTLASFWLGRAVGVGVAGMGVYALFIGRSWYTFSDALPGHGLGLLGRLLVVIVACPTGPRRRVCGPVHEHSLAVLQAKPCTE